MKIDKDIIVCGDIHAEFGSLNHLVNHHSPKIILCCGDFGYWPRWPGGLPSIPKIPDGTIVRFVDGNHEDHESLKLSETGEVYPNVFHMKRGSIHQLPDGRNILFMGGAASRDKHVRTIGIDWFQEEEISVMDIYKIPQNVRIDIVVSHTCPKEFLPHIHDTDNDWSRTALSYVLDKYSPSIWYFGHWHMYKTGYHRSTRWICLDMVHGSTGRWWEYLLD